MEQRGFLRRNYYTLRYDRGQLLRAGKLFQQVLEVICQSVLYIFITICYLKLLITKLHNTFS